MYSISRGAHFSHAYIATDGYIPLACTDLYSLASQPQGLCFLCTGSTLLWYCTYSSRGLKEPKKIKKEGVDYQVGALYLTL